VSTGPLGQGISNGVGMAIASYHLQSLFNTEEFPNLINNNIYVVIINFKFSFVEVLIFFY
jgi:transketolase